MSELATFEELLRVWFGEPGGSPLAVSKQWFSKNDEFDRFLRERFGATLEAGARGELSEWKTTPRGKLGLIVLFDQLSRNTFRGSPRSFAQDPLALALTLDMLESGEARALSHVERYFVLMPLMHSEDVGHQRRCIAEFEKLRDEAPSDLRSLFESAVEYAHKHAVIVERFGRFPHRNAVLGRESTAEEKEFLTQPGSSF